MSLNHMDFSDIRRQTNTLDWNGCMIIQHANLHQYRVGDIWKRNKPLFPGLHHSFVLPDPIAMFLHPSCSTVYAYIMCSRIIMMVTAMFVSFFRDQVNRFTDD